MWDDGRVFEFMKHQTVTSKICAVTVGKLKQLKKNMEGKHHFFSSS